jgi:RNA polymerase sigma factor (sigma-70 family)
MPDADLIAACLAGESAAWDTLIARYKAVIFATLMRQRLPEADAEDIFHEVCLLLLNHLEDLRDTQRLAGWLVTTTRREIWRLHRQRGPTLASEMPGQEWLLEGAQSVGGVSQPSVEESLLALEEQQAMRHAMAQLPERCRRLLTLLYCEEPPCGYTEAAERLRLPIGSIGPSRARCLQKLQQLLAKENALP